MAHYQESAVGIFRHPWFNKPDTKFNEDGLFQTDLIASGPEAEEMARRIEQRANAHLAEHTAEMKPGEAKKWGVYLPFERLTDDETGEPTGEIKFTMKQNAKVRSKKEPSGFKAVKINVVDSQNNTMSEPVWDGSEGRIMYSMRPIEISSSRLAGVRLDFAAVQVLKLKSGSGGGGGFSKVEGGYVSNRTQSDSSEASGGGDEEDY